MGVIDGYPSTLAADLDTTLDDSGTGRHYLYGLDALLRLTLCFEQGSRPQTGLLEGTVDLLWQANATGRANRSTATAEVEPRCPCCAEKPVAAVLRPEGDGGTRFLLCWLCFTEWEHCRRGCPNCGEADADKLRVYTAEEFPHIQVESCETCRVYLKAIDLTRNGRAVPEVDELASVTLDLWATEHGYTKLQSNLFGM